MLSEWLVIRRHKGNGVQYLQTPASAFATSKWTSDVAYAAQYPLQFFWSLKTWTKRLHGYNVCLLRGSAVYGITLRRL